MAQTPPTPMHFDNAQQARGGIRVANYILDLRRQPDIAVTSPYYETLKLLTDDILAAVDVAVKELD